ncbi:MAG: hypothetical protein MAG431_00842 [Chloroflexi bacterium]|nr:hypothetical protein [Chloroflexota bacterium]
MNIRHTLQNITFEWDSRKANANLHKHGISFEVACEVFFDPFVSYQSKEVVSDEIRESIIGMTTNWRLLYVVYAFRGDIIRIISARLVTKKEREDYENQ